MIKTTRENFEIDLEISFRRTDPGRGWGRHNSFGLFALEDEHHEEDDKHHKEESANSAADDHRSPVLVLLLLCEHNANTTVFEIEFAVFNEGWNVFIFVKVI